MFDFKKYEGLKLSEFKKMITEAGFKLKNFTNFIGKSPGFIDNCMYDRKGINPIYINKLSQMLGDEVFQYVSERVLEEKRLRDSKHNLIKKKITLADQIDELEKEVSAMKKRKNELEEEKKSLKDD